MNWLITDKGDQDVRRLADRHYSRLTPGAAQFCRNGQNLVFITADLKAGWVTFRATPGRAVRPDGLNAWECTLFRNEGDHISSELIREAVLLSRALWGEVPPDGFLTYVRPAAIATEIPGYCFRCAGWRRVKSYTREDQILFRAPRASTPPPDRRAWKWRGNRGGAERRRLEQPSLFGDTRP